MRTASLIPLWAAVAAIALVGEASAQLNDRVGGEPTDRRVDSKLAIEVSKSHAQGFVSPTWLDTVWVGYSGDHLGPGNYWGVGVGPNRPGTDPDGYWGWEPGLQPAHGDTLQGWWPVRRAYTLTGRLTLPDVSRPWWALDFGNQANFAPGRTHGRTFGVTGIWHVDAGANVPGGQGGHGGVTWAPLSGSASAWCGVRSAGDYTHPDAAGLGGYGNWYNQDVLGFNGENSDQGGGTSTNYPGYANQWDQLLYRDVRVANGASLTVGYEYRTRMSTAFDRAASTRTGWFDKDPLGVSAGNLISSSNAGAGAPVDSFMVYVGCPVNPENVTLSDGSTGNAVYDLKRRWFSEVIAIDKPYTEILSVAGDHTDMAASTVLPNAVIQPMLDADGTSADGGGIVRVVFRSKTNRGWSDQDGGTTGYGSGTEGAVRIDDVTITGGATTIASGFETAAEINNSIEPPNATSPGPAVGQGYALGSWKSTGKPPAAYFHAHDLSTLVYEDPAGPPGSPHRLCDLGGVVISAGDHDRGEAAGGMHGSAEQEVMDGLISPTINLVTSGVPGVPNTMGITPEIKDATDDYYIRYDVYSGALGLRWSGNAWTVGMQSYPARQANGVACWGELQTAPFQMFDPRAQCFFDVVPGFINGLIRTSNADGMPDSLRIFIGKNQQCFRFAVSLGCSPTSGAYFDNVALGLADIATPTGRGNTAAAAAIALDPEQTFSDAFPFNNTPGLPGTAAFDTCAAAVQSRSNIAPGSTTTAREYALGDTAVVRAGGEGTRVDLVFRILPGPGSYVMAGNRASGLRRLPTSPAMALPGDGSFWGEYLADNGTFGSAGGHAGGAWKPEVWNSARCDTAEINLFPVRAQGNIVGLVPGRWASMYHESDPKYLTLGVPKNRCFVVDTLQAPSRWNVTCTEVPSWTANPGSGYDGSQQTREYTKIIPDGLLTPGSQVQYFYRKSSLAEPALFAGVPDTMVVFPQRGEGRNFELHRWQWFNVLPNRWSDPAYGGLGRLCMLYVNEDPGGGDDTPWQMAAEDIGATDCAEPAAGEKDGPGAEHDGDDRCGGPWRVSAEANAMAGAFLTINDKGISLGLGVRIEGTLRVEREPFLWEGYSSLDFFYTLPGGFGLNFYATGRVGLTPNAEMLGRYYGTILESGGRVLDDLMGPVLGKPLDGVSLLRDWWDFRRGLGHESEFLHYGLLAEQALREGGSLLDFVDMDLKTDLRESSFSALSGCLTKFPEFKYKLGQPGPNYNLYSTETGDFANLNVLRPFKFPLDGAVGAESSGQEEAYYQDYGSNGPYVACVFTPAGPDHPARTMVCGFSIQAIYTPFGESRSGGSAYFHDVLGTLFGTAGQIVGSPSATTDVPGGTGAVPPFVRLCRNPALVGEGCVSFGLPRADRVVVRVYDVSGRVVRTLADRTFASGAHQLVWDGSSDDGARVRAGVYFTQVRSAGGDLASAKKLVLVR